MVPVHHGEGAYAQSPDVHGLGVPLHQDHLGRDVGAFPMEVIGQLLSLLPPLHVRIYAIEPQVTILLDEELLQSEVAVCPVVLMQALQDYDELGRVEDAQLLRQGSHPLNDFVELAPDGERPEHVEFVLGLEAVGGQEDEGAFIAQFFLHLGGGQLHLGGRQLRPNGGQQ